VNPILPRLLRLALAIVGLAIAGGDCRAQDIRRAVPNASNPQPPVAPAAPAGPSAIERSGMSAVPVDPNRRLAVGDVVSFEIIEDRDPAVLRKVSATGELDISPFGRVRVSGKTTSEAEAVIKAFLEKDYYYTATPRVALDTVNPVAVLRKILISGEVRSPGPLEIAAGERLTLSEAILRAGNFTQWAKKDKVKLTRGGSQQIYDVRKITAEGRVDDDPVLQDGDRIHVDKNWFNIRGD
jgi:protein involved in polysaccharide export with SLBB domain